MLIAKVRQASCVPFIVKYNALIYIKIILLSAIILQNYYRGVTGTGLSAPTDYPRLSSAWMSSAIDQSVIDPSILCGGGGEKGRGEPGAGLGKPLKTRAPVIQKRY
jgi:hypothetical protein